MKNSFLKFIAVAMVIGVSFIALSNSGLAKTKRTRSATNQAPPLLTALPPSDAVALIKVSRVLDEALPKLLAENPAKIAQVNDELASFKAKTGLDPRSFDQIALSLKYAYPSEGVTKVTAVALASGTFNPGAMVAAGRIAANGKYSEHKHLGQMIYVFTLDQEVRLLGLWGFKVRDLAVTSLDGNMLALGDLDAVRGVIDAHRTRKYANPELIALASRDPNAIVGFGGDVSESLMENLRISNDGIARELTGVRKVYGSLALTSSDLELMLAARTVDAYAAKNLSDTVEGLKQLGGFFVGRLSAAKSTLARTALNNLKITTQGNELHIRTAVAQSQVAPLMRGN